MRNLPADFPINELYEGRSGNTLMAVISLTQDKQTWIGGIAEGDSFQHVGSFATLEEGQRNLESQLGVETLVWTRGR